MGSETPTSRRRGRRWLIAVGLLLFVGYASWMLGPYLRSVVVRDAAITTWSNISTAPIDGTIEFRERNINGRIGEEGVVAYVRNDHASREAVERARLARDLAAARVEELELYLQEIIALDGERQDLKVLYAATFRDQLDVQIANLEREIAITLDLLSLIRTIADRKSQLVERGVGSPNEADEAQLRVRDVEYELARLEAELAFARVRREAADRGVFTTEDGDDPAWVRGSRIELKLEKKQARLQLREAEAALVHARSKLASAEADFARLSTAVVLAPPGSVIWSEHVVSGMAVLAGDAIAEWLDCSRLLVDVPVSDVEVSLIEPGHEASVVLEGGSEPILATVIVTRGAASTLDETDLVAVAKGREPGTAQVLLELPDLTDRFDDCPVGQAAFVDFPHVGLLDVVAARLRL